MNAHPRLSFWIACLGLTLPGVGLGEPGLTLVKEGAQALPVMVAAEVPFETVRAARHLVDYLEKTTGARPELHEGAPEPLPDSAIWVGHHAEILDLYPDMDWAFSKPEEIRLFNDGRHLVMLGRDRMLGGEQVEFGTANAVYTFLQQYLGVRWFWPGELGEDVLERDTVTLDAFDYRFAPPFRMRNALPLRWQLIQSSGGDLVEWNRFQRNYLDSLKLEAGHAFGDWWNRYHEAHPDYFAKQPDGTRSGFPGPSTAKLCETNPRVWAQWLFNAVDRMVDDPTWNVFNAAPNDGSNAGLCVCDDCRAWDTLEGPRYRLNWRGLTQEYVAMTDRYGRFWNRLGSMLRATFPERDDLLVTGMAYGPAKPPPVNVALADNVIIGYVGHFPTANDMIRENEKAQFREWGDNAAQLFFRPNVFWYSGGWHGIPTPAVRNTIEDIRFLAENRCIGITLDHPPHHFSPFAPQHYAMVQMSWDPFQDGAALMADFYQRGFGPAADAVRGYYELMEAAHAQLVNTPGWRHSMGGIRWVADQIPECYHSDRMAEARRLLDEAQAVTAEGPERYRDRVAFVRASLDYTVQHLEILETMRKVRESGGGDREAVQRAIALCEAREQLFAESPEHAFRAHHFNVTWNRSRNMQDYLGPPSQRFQIAAGLVEGEVTAADAAADGAPAPIDKSAYTFVPAEEAGWTLTFEDRFDRTDLGEDWRAIDGAWQVEDGWLMSHGGTLVSERRFPGLQRLEFEAVTHVEPFPFFGPDTEAMVQYSDLSSFIHAGSDGFATGYFMQFGGRNNTVSQLLRTGNVLDVSREHLIEPGKVHHIVAENDGEQVRLIVDGTLVVAWPERAPLLGEAHERVGFYFWTGARIRNVRVYTREVE